MISSVTANQSPISEQANGSLSWEGDVESRASRPIDGLPSDHLSRIVPISRLHG